MSARFGRRSSRRFGFGMMPVTGKQAAREGGGSPAPVGKAPARAMFEGLESRRLFAAATPIVTTLTSGMGAGAMSVTVDAYGAFGITPTTFATQYGSFAVGSTGHVDRSYVYFSPLRTFLTTGGGSLVDASGATTSGLEAVSFAATTATSATSTFVLSGTEVSSGAPYSYQVSLTQTVSPVVTTAKPRYTGVPTADLQSTLSQTYTITNLLGTPATFSLVRYFQTQQDQDVSGPRPSFNGNKLFDDGGRTLGVSGIADGNFTQIQSTGGTFAGAAIRSESLDTRIAAANGISSSLAGLEGDDGTGATTLEYFAGLAQQHDYAVGGRESVVFTTSTTFGQRTTIRGDFVQELPGDPFGTSGQVGFANQEYNYTFPRNPDNTFRPMTVTLRRVPSTTGDPLPAVSVQVTTVAGSADTTIYSIPTPVVNFAAGQTEATVQVLFTNPQLVSTTQSSFSLQLTPAGTSTAAAIGGPSFVTVNLYPRTSDFQFSTPTTNYAFPRDASGNLLPLVVTVNRLGTTIGPAVGDPAVASGQPSSVSRGVRLNLTGGTTPTGAYTITPSLIDFADGQFTGTAIITFNPALAGLEPTSFNLSLSTAGDANATLPPATLTVNVLPTAPVFQLQSATATAAAGQTLLPITIVRSGTLNGTASVTFATTTAGTAIAGTDFTPTTQLVTFADGQTSAVVNIPLLNGNGDGRSRTITYALTPATPGGVVGGTPSVVGTLAAGTATFSSIDALGPTVTRVTTITSGRGISGVVLTFSEPLRGAGALSSFSLFARSGEGAFGSSRLSRVRISGASYDPAFNTITVIPSRPLSLNINYQITVRPDAGLTDLTGNVLNRNPSGGTPASYTALFARATKITYADRSGDRVQLTVKQGSLELVRTADGEAATVTLFGTDAATTLFTAAVRNRGGNTTIGRIVNSNLATLIIPANVTVLQQS